MSSISAERTTGDDLFAELGFEPVERAEVVRTGERDPISQLLRHLIYRRDGWMCQQCRAVPYHRNERRISGALHLDHIIPWSAGGSDRSDNLRTLCGPCNTRRSNFVSRHDRPSMPIVRQCAPCSPWLRIDGKPSTAFTAYCGCHHHEGWVVPGWQIL